MDPKIFFEPLWSFLFNSSRHASNLLLSKANPCIYTDSIYIFFLQTWGNNGFFGLSGIEVIGEDGSVIPVDYDRSYMFISNARSWIVLSGDDLASLFLPPFVTLEPSFMFRFPLLSYHYYPKLFVRSFVLASPHRSA